MTYHLLFVLQKILKEYWIEHNIYIFVYLTHGYVYKISSGAQLLTEN